MVSGVKSRGQSLENTNKTIRPLSQMMLVGICAIYPNWQISKLHPFGGWPGCHLPIFPLFWQQYQMVSSFHTNPAATLYSSLLLYTSPRVSDMLICFPFPSYLILTLAVLDLASPSSGIPARFSKLCLVLPPFGTSCEISFLHYGPDIFSLCDHITFSLKIFWMWKVLLGSKFKKSAPVLTKILFSQGNIDAGLNV